MNDKRTGETTTPEELFTHCVALAEMTDSSLKANRALKDEIQREHTAVVNGIGKVEQLYTPEHVVRTVEKARVALAEFKQEAADTIVTLKQEADAMMKSAVRRWLVCIAIACACLAAAVVALTHLVPGFDEIQSRRGEVAKLITEGNALEQQLKAKRQELLQWQGKLFTYNGQLFVRIFNAPQQLCIEGQLAESCNFYAPLK